MSASSSPTPNRRRRGSSVGKINVGDTAVPGYSTTKITASQKQQSDDRIKALSDESDTDRAILRKLFVAYKELSFRHTWINPLIILSFFFLTYAATNEESLIHNTLKRLIKPAYHIEGTNQYGKGGDDFLFVGFYALFFTFLREFVMCVFLRPTAHFLGVKRPHKVNRFMEQGYAMFYYGLSGPFGLYVMSTLPIWFFETAALYETYPHRTHDWYGKVYYLGQAAFWVQQSVVLVLQLEKPRKDFQELILHHIVTIALIWLSYRFHFTWMGIEIYVTMDVSDFFLATSKVLNYLDSILTAPFYIMFVGIWIYLRHWINIKILWSVLTEFRTVGDFQLNWDTQQYKCWISQPIVFFLIFALQLLNLYWLFLLLRILFRYVVGGVKADERSEDEDEEEEAEAARQKDKTE